MWKFALGDSVKDIISGFAGIVDGRTEWLNGCRRYIVQPRGLKKEDGLPLTNATFDEEQLQSFGKGIKAVKMATASVGGPRQTPARRGE